MVTNTNIEVNEKKEWQTPCLIELKFKNTKGSNEADTGEDSAYVNIS